MLSSCPFELTDMSTHNVRIIKTEACMKAFLYQHLTEGMILVLLLFLHLSFSLESHSLQLEVISYKFLLPVN